MAELTHQILIFTGNTVNLCADVDINELVKRNVALLKSRIPRTTTLHFKIHKNQPIDSVTLQPSSIVPFHLTTLPVGASMGAQDIRCQINLTGESPSPDE